MKKIFLLSTVLLVAPVVALAQGFVPLAPIPGLTQGVVADSSGLASFFNNLYKYSIGLAAALAVIQIIWAGLDIAFFHKDAVGAITDDKGKIYNAIFGLVLVLSPVLVFSIINPSILNLSLNLPALKTASGPPATSGTAQTTTPYTPSATEVADRPAGTNILFSFEVDPNISPSAVIQILNVKLSECTNATGGPGIILPASLQTTLRRFVCQTCEPGRTAVPRLTCARQNTTFVCGNCN
jgi:hypothetical protein